MIPTKQPDYLSRLERRIAAGSLQLPPWFMGRHMDYLERSQRPDGGFAGPGGPSDLYYTHFALESAHLPGSARRDDDAGKEPNASGGSELWTRARSFVQSALPTVDNVVDCYCALRSLNLLERCDVGREAQDFPGRARRLLDGCRQNGGGYATRPDGTAGVYQTFLAGLCYAMLDDHPPDVRADTAFILDRRCADGGFADNPTNRREMAGGANPTAAAIGYLKEWSNVDDDVAREAISFLGNLQDDDGGFLAHARSPMPDLLSTFTSLVTLDDADALESVRLAPAGRFVRRLSQRYGGFCATQTHDSPDPEYTYYGLGSFAVLGNKVS